MEVLIVGVPIGKRSNAGVAFSVQREDHSVVDESVRAAGVVRSFSIKDHRNWPKDQNCGPGFGEIDHYRLLDPVAFTGLKMPLCCENIFAPLLPRPDKPEGIDDLARRARLSLETVTAGLQV